MIDFSTLQGLTIPEGVVTQIADASGRVLWSGGWPKDLNTGLEFTSASRFGIGVDSPKWNGTMEYCNGSGWKPWDGSPIEAKASESGYSVYIRGTGNTVVSATNYNQSSPFVLGGGSSGIECNGNIENLLDYSSVLAGVHPTMEPYCFHRMFNECGNLTTAPSLPATTLAESCYSGMFMYCTSLTAVPMLPATTLVQGCYENMFNNCTNLTTAPSLPATTLAASCYNRMFWFCTSLTAVPMLPATTLPERCYTNMFIGCSAIKVSATQTGTYTKPYRIPYSGNGSAEINSLSTMFNDTGGTFAHTPQINTTYYLDESNTIV